MSSVLKTLLQRNFLSFSGASTTFQRSRLFFSSAVMRQDGIARTFDNIVKPKIDKREYRGLELQNGMRVLLVADAEADKSAASLDVGVGHMSDPFELPGLAHFCEHMLFLGTEKYPLENEYSKYLAANAGSSNAYTGSDSTNYYFDVKPEAFEGALDRFVQFFLSPQFTASATEREVCAVDSEHANNLKSDAWRLLQIERHTCKPDHDYSKFGTGNKQTLLVDARAKGIEPREALLKFYSEQYSSNIMGLTVVGKNSLDELQELVCKLGFPKIANKNVVPKVWDEAFGEEECGRIIEIVPIKDSRSLRLMFPLPDLSLEYKEASCLYLSHLIGHEAPGSLLFELKRLGLVSSLNAGYGKTARGFGAMKISIELTIDGLANVNNIIAHIFSYIGMMKSAGPQQWIHDEYRRRHKIEFDFQDNKTSQKIALETSSNLHTIPMEDILAEGYIIEQFRAERVAELTSLLTPSRLYARVISKSFEGQRDLQTEPVYGTKMRIRNFDEATMSQFLLALSSHSTDSSPYHLPARNEFLPKKFELKPRESEKNEHPILIRADRWSRVWFKQDDEYLRPKMVAQLCIIAPCIGADPKSTTAVGLAVECLEDAITGEVYNAHLGGLEHSINVTCSGIYLKVKGFDEKLPLFLHFLLEKMLTFQPDAARFEVMKENLLRSLRNFSHSQPYLISQHLSQLVLQEKGWSKQQRLIVAKDLTCEDIANVFPSIFSAFHVEVLVHGNTVKEEAFGIADETIRQIRDKHPSSRSLFSNECPLSRDRDVGIGNSFRFRQPQSTHASSSVEFILQIGQRSLQNSVLLDVLVQMMSDSAFNQLRTIETLGYIVFSFARSSVSASALEVLVQGPNDPEMVDERIEAFLLSFRDTLAKMDEATFKTYIDAVITQKQEKPKTLGGRFNRFWSQIDTRQYMFDIYEREIDYVRTVKLEEVLDFYDKKVMKDAPQRRKLAVFVHSSTDTAEDVKMKQMRKSREAREVPGGDSEGEFNTKTEEIEYIDAGLSRLGFFGLPKPAMSLPPMGTYQLECDEESKVNGECKADV